MSRKRCKHPLNTSALRVMLIPSDASATATQTHLGHTGEDAVNRLRPALSGWSFIRVGVVLLLLFLVSPWLRPDLYLPPLTSGSRTHLFTSGDASFNASLFSPSISPFQKQLSPFGDGSEAAAPCSMCPLLSPR
ncbi:hypothetical protein PV04_00049 [Phialophora macrospora]|uniref:Uncharacterized protein n=1 Tax=Phialophora macrospora TaxID=1851006 RepID=A0A0D2EC06_9EURO|nr:hypothetical protein PV04_00049 [Phialophora macrospora]